MVGLGFAKRRLIDEIAKKNWNIENPSSKLYTYMDILYIIQEMSEKDGIKYLEHSTNINFGHHVYREFVKLLLYRNVANFDSMVLLTADKGGGKSSAALMLAKQWCKLLGIKFDPAKHMAFSNADVMNKIDSLPKFSPLIADEAVRFALGCLDGNTLIKTVDGEIKIKDLVNKKNFKVYSYNQKTKKVEIQVAERCVKVKTDIVYEMEMEDGTKIRATKEHKFLTNNGLKTLNELKKGDELVTV